jgi:hypothetical protein
LIASVDHFEAVEGFTSIRGATEKDILRDPATGDLHIAKLGAKNNDLEVMTEYAISLIGRSLGIVTADARIASYKGKLRFLSRYFLNIQESEELVHGVQLFKDLYDETTLVHVLGNKSREQDMFSVQSVRAAFGAHYVHYGHELEEELFSGFVSMLTHDALLGVMDRHHENWGLIVRRESSASRPRFAPLYDSARGLFCNETDAHLKRHFHGPAGSKRLDAYVAKAHPLFGYEGLKARPGWHYVTHPQLLAAVFHGYPGQRERIVQILASYDWRHVAGLLRSELPGLCSALRVDLILACIRRRQKAIYRAISGPSAG